MQKMEFEKRLKQIKYKVNNVFKIAINKQISDIIQLMQTNDIDISYKTSVDLIQMLINVQRTLENHIKGKCTESSLLCVADEIKELADNNDEIALIPELLNALNELVETVYLLSGYNDMVFGYEFMRKEQDNKL